MPEKKSDQAWSSFRTDMKTLFDALGEVTRDAKVREGTRQAARSLGSALGKTLREVGDDIDKAVRRGGRG